MQPSSHFNTTRWTLVLDAVGGNSPRREAALAELLGGYWYPLYSFVRRQGYAVHEAEDLLQGFFARLLEKDTLRAVREGQGRFRNFLLVCLRRYLANELERSAAKKRGGGTTTLSYDFQAADARYSAEPDHELTAEKQFERDWAVDLIAQAYARLASAWDDAGKADQFRGLGPYLVGPDSSLSYAETAARLGMTEGAVKTAVHRLRAQFRQVLCELVAATLDRDELLEDEIRRLFAALSP